MCTCCACCDLTKENAKCYRSLESFLFGSSASSRLVASVSSSEDSEAEEEPKKAKKRPKRSDGSSSSDSDDDDVQAGKKRGRTAAWHDDDDDETQVQDVVASYAKAKGKHGAKEASSESYADSIRKKFMTMVDTPKWADLGRTRGSEEDSDDEFFRVRHVLQITFSFLFYAFSRKIFVSAKKIQFYI